MKLIIIAALFFVGCTKKETAKEVAHNAVASETTTILPDASVVVVSEYKLPLAWGSGHSDWDGYLIDALSKIPIVSVDMPCKKISVKACTAQLISIMAKYESSFKPETSYAEGGNLKGVISRGLLQISKDSANGYGCGITDAKHLHDPKTNLECAVKILARWAAKDGTLMGEPKLGCARYWSVCRKSSGSNAKILKYMQQL